MSKSPVIWLASKSPRRAELLSQMGVSFELLLPDDPVAAEALEAPRPNEAPDKYVVRVTLAKLALARQKLNDQQLEPRPILVADTTVAIGSRMLGKPEDNAQCAQMMRALSGRRHRVLTAVAVARGSRVKHKLQVSRVTFSRLSAQQIQDYVELADGLDKAGGYGIQGAAARFIRHIDGSYSGIMGLPIYETAQLLKL
jgi:septum formation protein